MSKRKGLSFDEKKATLLAAMHAEATFYTLKELENLGKSKGVIPQAVKDVVESLCADGDITNEKVGSQQIFWALPSQRTVALRNKKHRFEEEATKLEHDRDQLQAEIARLSAMPTPSAEEVSNMKVKLTSDRQRLAELVTQVNILERYGPRQLEELRKKTEVAKEAANRWADNVCTVRSMFIRERRGEVSANQFNEAFGLPADFEYVE